jgi:hypothetical protein
MKKDHSARKHTLMAPYKDIRAEGVYYTPSARIGAFTCYTERRKTNREVKAVDMGAVVAEGRGNQL